MRRLKNTLEENFDEPEIITKIADVHNKIIASESLDHGKTQAEKIEMINRSLISKENANEHKLMQTLYNHSCENFYYEPIFFLNDEQDILKHVKVITQIKNTNIRAYYLVENARNCHQHYLLKCFRYCDIFCNQVFLKLYNQLYFPVKINEIVQKQKQHPTKLNEQLFFASNQTTLFSRDHIFVIDDYIFGSSVYCQSKRLLDGFTLDHKWHYIAQAAQALAFLNSNNIVLGCLDPRKVMVNHRGFLKITDFKCAKDISAPDTLFMPMLKANKKVTTQQRFFLIAEILNEGSFRDRHQNEHVRVELEHIRNMLNSCCTNADLLEPTFNRILFYLRYYYKKDVRVPFTDPAIVRHFQYHPANDIWTLGMFAFCLYTGMYTFKNDTAVKTVFDHIFCDLNCGELYTHFSTTPKMMNGAPPANYVPLFVNEKMKNLELEYLINKALVISIFDRIGYANSVNSFWERIKHDLKNVSDVLFTERYSLEREFFLRPAPILPVKENLFNNAKIKKINIPKVDAPLNETVHARTVAMACFGRRGNTNFYASKKM